MQEIINIGNKCRELFYCEEDFPSFVSTDICIGGISTLQEQYVITRCLPDLNNLLITLSGRGKFKVGELEGSCVKDSVLLMPAGIPFHYEIYGDEPWEIVWLLLPNSPGWREFPGTPKLFETGYGQQVRTLMSQLEQERCFRPEESHRMCQLVTEQLQLVLKRILRSQQSVSLNTQLAKVFAHVELSLDQPWTVEKIADKAFLSRATAQRHCSQLYGMGIKQKVAELRFNRAAALLKMTRYSIEAIAHQVGFDEAFNFSTRFKQRFGVTPSAYRKG